MAHKKIKGKRRPSLIFGFVDRLTALIYSFFVNGRTGDMLSSRRTLCKRSYLARVFEQKKARTGSVLMKYPESLMERSISSRTLIFLRKFWATLKINVYGMFFTFYGLSACIAYLIPAFINGRASYDDKSVLTAAIIAICSVPLLFSSQSAIEAISSSRVLGKIVLDILCVPEEHLKVKKQYGGTIYMFCTSVIAMLLGGLSLFTNVLFVPIVILCLMVIFAVFSYPEIGVVIILAMIPFMKYFPNPEMILLVMVLSTGVSYFCKVFQRKRTFSLSPEITMILLFCGFILTGGMFSYGGMQTFIDSLTAVVLILGGLLLTYNLINTKKMLSACLKTITVSFLVLCLIGIWESLYNGLSARIIDSVSPNISSIADENILYILDNGIVFGMFAVFVFPLLFAYIAKRKSVKGASAITVLCLILIMAAWMCSHYEIIVALAIECILFWFMFSYKTMNAVIFALIPIGIAVLVYPYAVSYFGMPDISDILMEYMPANMTDSEHHISVISDVINMITDGNLFGIGVGEHAFMSVFPAYAGEASLGVEHPMSFWLQIICWSGIFGFVAFSVFALFMLKTSLGFFIAAERNEIRSKALALFCGIIAVLLLGNVYSIWSDGRAMYLFWVFTGLLMGYIRLGNSEDDIKRAELLNCANAADIKVEFYD